MAMTSYLVIALFAFAPHPTSADLGAAVWRSQRRQSSDRFVVAGAPSQPNIWPIVVPLRRSSPRHLEKAPEGASFYVGSVSVGNPAKQMQVMFDTSSGHLLFAHRACKSSACLEHRAYSPWESRTAVDVNADGENVQTGTRLAKGNVSRTGVRVEFTQSDLGEGAAVGVAVNDSLCLLAKMGGKACTDVTLLAALKMDEAPFRAMPHDGIIGLGLAGLSSAPMLNFISSLKASWRDMLPHFGITYGEEDGEIHFGAHDRARIATPLQWFPVLKPEEGFWQVAIRHVRVGGITVNDCSSGCRAIIDSGASRLGVEKRSLPALRDALSSVSASGKHCQGPDLEFDLGGMAVILRPSEYTSPQKCDVQLGELNLEEPEFAGVFAFGETVLRRYYTAFDWGEKRVGFARALRRGALGLGRATAVPVARPEVHAHGDAMFV
jgi:cathepsin D